jgi:hypothetical protein
VPLIAAAPNLSTVLLGVATAVLLPLFGWVGKEAWDFNRESGVTKHRIDTNEAGLKAHVADTEECFAQLRKDTQDTFAQFRKDMQDTNIRVTRTEDAAVELRGHVQRSDEQFAIILLKLEQLPRLSALLEAWSEAVKNAVPRPEMEVRISAVEKSNLSLQGQVNDIHRDRREV